MSEPLGLCLVGPGAIAAAHMDAHTRAGLSEKRWVVGPTPEAAAAFADTWCFDRSTAELDEALADDAVDVVMITTPHELHTPQALRALEAGKHVICEIPVAMTAADAERVDGRAKAVGKRVLVCHTQRSFPAVRELRNRVRAGELTISQIAGFHCNPRRHNENWIGGTRDWADNLLWHGCCHYVDTSLWVLGMPRVESVHGQLGRPNLEWGMTMDVTVSFKTERTELVSHCATYNVGQPGPTRMLFVADEGLFRLERTRLVDEDENELFPATSPTDTTLQDAEMIASLADGTPSEFEVDTVLATMSVLEQAQASAEAQ